LAERKSSTQGRERLLGIIDICKSVEEGKHDPFTLEIDELQEVIQRYFQAWESMEDKCLDAQAINRLATVVKLQGSWLKDRSTSLYADPFLIEQKLLKLQKDDLASVFLRSWHPVVELEQISPESLKAAIEYWRNLLPLADRWRGLPEGYEFELGVTSYEDLIKEEIASDQAFDDSIKSLWGELKDRSKRESKLDYWEFVQADSFLETIRRAYITSFLITYGYADLVIDAVSKEMSISPKKRPKLNLEEKGTVSIPIPISYEKWVEGRREKES